MAGHFSFAGDIQFAVTIEDKRDIITAASLQKHDARPVSVKRYSPAAHVVRHDLFTAFRCGKPTVKAVTKPVRRWEPIIVPAKNVLSGRRRQVASISVERYSRIGIGCVYHFARLRNDFTVFLSVNNSVNAICLINACIKILFCIRQAVCSFDICSLNTANITGF